MSFPVSFGLPQIGLLVLLAIGLALLVAAALPRTRRRGLKSVLGRAIPGTALLLAATLLLWIATLLQTYLGLTGEIKAAHVVAKTVGDRALELDVTTFDTDGAVTDRTTHRVEGDLWVMQAAIVELEPWVNALGFHSGYTLTRLYGQRLDGRPTTRSHIFLNGSDRDFFEDMRENRWYTSPFIRSAYGNAVIAAPGEYDVCISRDAIKICPAN
ncbi:hypothetical protein [Nocardia caishijiensis]|uniref:Uncharacterized protein n=1 Tax=Nocardia caishijiensis TaxID=184756 RepID=A0ABQ6YFD4_9NOCA|nr:hypothetical protein [Nocardia caishijiensis]KAF0836684.1 hypothetical protein FNL39_11392 [Nocardia caishijiensis]